MPHKFNPDRLELLMSPERAELNDPSHVFSFIPLENGQTVADIGCGPGYFTLALARRLPDGHVHAFDVQAPMLQAARENVASASLTNVTVAEAQELELPAPDDSFDGAFIAFALHEIDGPLPEYFAMVARKLKAGGWVAVLDWKKEEMDEGPPLHDRLSEDEVRKSAEAGGLDFSHLADLNSKQYIVLFRMTAG